MWITTNASDDTHDLDLIQHNMYFFSDQTPWFNAGKREFCIQHGGILHGSCSYIFAIARASMIRKSSGLPVYKNKNLADIESFDHRILQNAHGEIASFYRWIQSGKSRKPALSGNQTTYAEWRTNNRGVKKNNESHSPLSAYHKYLLESWKTYFTHEINDIVYGNPPIAEQIVIAVWRGNTDLGYEAEDKIDAFLTSRYGTEFQQEHQMRHNSP